MTERFTGAACCELQRDRQSSVQRVQRFWREPEDTSSTGAQMSIAKHSLWQEEDASVHRDLMKLSEQPF